MSRRNEFLDHDESNQSGSESGYDSEAAEVTKIRKDVESGHIRKRRKLSHSSYTSEEEEVVPPTSKKEKIKSLKRDHTASQPRERNQATNSPDVQPEESDYKIKSAADAVSKPSKKSKKEKTPGVIYLSSLPPYLKPSALKNLLSHRGFGSINRLFLTPASKHKNNSKKSSRQLYTEGWIEFTSKKMAKDCAEALNAQLIGGRKGGFYHDDIWNMKYLRGMAWDELMAGIREERREEEGRRDEERRKIAAETKAFVEGVEQSKKLEGIKRKRKSKTQGDGGGEDVQRTWRQHELAQDRSGKSKSEGKASIDPQVQQVLSKIF